MIQTCDISVYGHDLMKEKNNFLGGMKTHN